MNDETVEQLRKLLPALKSLQTTVERAYNTGISEGVGKMSVRTYNVLQQKVAALMPDDVYVTEALRLDVDEAGPEKEQIAQVNLAAGQLYHYLKNLIQEPWLTGEDLRELKGIGRELQDQILNTTRNALRRAMSGLDHMPPMPPTPPTPPTPPASPKIRIELDDDSDPKNTPII